MPDYNGFPLLSAEEAAALIPHGATLAAPILRERDAKGAGGRTSPARIAVTAILEKTCLQANAGG